MTKKTKVLFLVCLAGFLALPALLNTAPKGTSVYLRASFRDAADAYGMPTDKLRSDGQGSYQNAAGLTVMINGDGELVFDIGRTSGRRVNLIFDQYIRYGSCPENPPDAADEPIDTAQFLTQMESYMAGPKVNFLEMRPGDVKEVRLWIVLTTALRSYFYLSYDQEAPESRSGYVMVHATDATGDGTVDRWVLYPKSGTNEMAGLNRRSYTGKNRAPCDFGDFQMPFELVLERL